MKRKIHFCSFQCRPFDLFPTERAIDKSIKNKEKNTHDYSKVSEDWVSYEVIYGKHLRNFHMLMFRPVQVWQEFHVSMCQQSISMFPCSFNSFFC